MRAALLPRSSWWSRAAAAAVEPPPEPCLTRGAARARCARARRAAAHRTAGRRAAARRPRIRGSRPPTRRTRLPTVVDAEIGCLLYDNMCVIASRFCVYMAHARRQIVPTLPNNPGLPLHVCLDLVLVVSGLSLAVLFYLYSSYYYYYYTYRLHANKTTNRAFSTHCAAATRVASFETQLRSDACGPARCLGSVHCQGVGRPAGRVRSGN